MLFVYPTVTRVIIDCADDSVPGAPEKAVPNQRYPAAAIETRPDTQENQQQTQNQPCSSFHAASLCVVTMIVVKVSEHRLMRVKKITPDRFLAAGVETRRESLDAG